MTTLLLTTTVRVEPEKLDCIYQTDASERIATYLKSIQQWLEKTKFNIVIVENSGYPWSELNDFLVQYKDRFEVISYRESDIERAHYLQYTNSKGAHEMFSIHYAYYQSQLIREHSRFVIKLTGRYFIPELESYLSKYDLDSYDVLCQNDIGRCEMVGSHIRNYHILFNPYLVNSRGHIEECVEWLYGYRIHDWFKHVFICKPFDIEPTQRGGKPGCFSVI